MDILKRSLAPITDRAWDEIDDAVRSILMTRLCGRKVVDVIGPEGMDKAAVGLGRLEITRQDKTGVGYGIHRVQPLVEGRIGFDLDVWELDNIERGAGDIDLKAAEDAALAMSRFEDQAVFNGFKAAGITGLTRLDGHKPLPLKLEPGALLDSLAQAVVTLNDAAIEGPFALVVGTEVFKVLSSQQTSGYPLQKQVANLVDGKVHYSTVLEGALLISRRGGDFELTLGQDLAIGYETHGDGKVRLFITESFTFRTLDPAACIHLPLKGK